MTEDQFPTRGSISIETLRTIHACLMELPRSDIQDIAKRALIVDIRERKRLPYNNKMDIFFGIFNISKIFCCFSINIYIFAIYF